MNVTHGSYDGLPPANVAVGHIHHFGTLACRWDGTAWKALTAADLGNVEARGGGMSAHEHLWVNYGTAAVVRTGCFVCGCTPEDERPEAVQNISPARCDTPVSPVE